MPRSRRLKNGWFIAPKASYRIKQGDEVVQIDTLAEKMRPGQVSGVMGRGRKGGSLLETISDTICFVEMKIIQCETDKKQKG